MKQTFFNLLAATMISIPALSAMADLGNNWRLLAPIPDPIGFAGMFAGVSGNALLAGGGSQFPHQPAWAGGKKIHNDRIYLLERPDAGWKILDQKLSSPRSLMASANYGEKILLLGGMNDEACLTEVIALSWQDGKLISEQLPDLPEPRAIAAAAVVGSHLYIAGGVDTPATNGPSKKAWRLNLADTAPKWEALPDLPGDAIFCAAGTGDGRYFYVIGGLAKSPERKAIALVHRFDPEKGAWETLPSLPSPRIAGCAVVGPSSEKEIFVVGGYANFFKGEQKDHPGFDSETYVYNPRLATWRRGPDFPTVRQEGTLPTSRPGPEPVVATSALLWQGHYIVISGEVRPATRTPAVVALPASAL